MPRAYSSPYQYNIIRPPGGVNEVGSQYTDLDRDYYGEFMDSYREGKDRKKQERLDKQEQAMRVSEMLGEVPPELEEDILGPVQPMDPTLGERALGGLGRLVGMDTEMGMPQEQFEVPEGGKLSTKHERELEKEARKAESEGNTKYLEFLRGLYNKQFTSDLAVQQKETLNQKGLFNPSLSFEQRKELVELKNAKPGRPLNAREKLQWDLYNGTKDINDITKKDMLILGKFWASMTPESRAEKALGFAQEMVAASQKGTVDKMNQDEIIQMTDDLAAEFIKKQDKILNELRGKEETGRKGGRSLGQIMGGQY
jgi:hypothetical protein